MKECSVIIGVIALMVVAALWVINIQTTAGVIGHQACTMEAKLCPDGSAVGRTEPNCKFAPCPITTATSTLAIDARATINGTTIGVLDLVEDSRCPADVQCIQAGTVRVRVSIDPYDKDFTFTLGKPLVVGNATITLISVTPAQKYAKQTIQPSDYRFTFTVVPQAATVSNSSGVRGTVSLGPTCPVERIPPDPACADKPYTAAIMVYRIGSNTPFMVGNSDTSGAFEFSLQPGSYTLKATGGVAFPRCNPTDVTIVKNSYATTTIFCDTGIR